MIIAITYIVAVFATWKWFKGIEPFSVRVAIALFWPFTLLFLFCGFAFRCVEALADWNFDRRRRRR